MNNLHIALVSCSLQTGVFFVLFEEILINFKTKALKTVRFQGFLASYTEGVLYFPITTYCLHFIFFRIIVNEKLNNPTAQTSQQFGHSNRFF